MFVRRIPFLSELPFLLITILAISCWDLFYFQPAVIAFLVTDLTIFYFRFIFLKMKQTIHFLVYSCFISVDFFGYIFGYFWYILVSHDFSDLFEWTKTLHQPNGSFLLLRGTLHATSIGGRADPWREGGPFQQL